MQKDTFSTVRIYTHPTYFYFKCDVYGWITPQLNVRRFLDKLTERTYNPVLRIFQIMYQYCYYDKTAETLSFPINTLDEFTDFLGDVNYIIQDMGYVTPRDVRIAVRSKFQPKEHQVELIDFLTDENRRFKALSAFTGSGKTYCTAAAISRIGHPALILTMGLIKQWYNELLDKTHLKKHEIYVIKGNTPLRKLIDSEGYYPKVIIASIRTMAMYAAAKKIPYDSILSYPEFQKKFGIGVVAVDEVHMDFYANTLIMLRTQVKHNIFLSATYERSSPQGERIFNMVFPSEVQFGGHIVKKYTATTMMSYTFSKPLNEQAFITKDGYSHALFEAKILRDKSLREEFLKAVVNTTLDAYYLRVREPGQKCLFICYTKDMVDAIGSYLTKHYPALGVLCFYGDLDDSLITSSIDVVVSTQRKSGTGRDIKGLRVAANTMSFKSLPLAKQMLGRLREIPGTLTYYLDFYCSTLNSHQRHAQKRRSRYQDLSLTFYETTV